jgi:hypothetical protein
MPIQIFAQAVPHQKHPVPLKIYYTTTRTRIIWKAQRNGACVHSPPRGQRGILHGCFRVKWGSAQTAHVGVSAVKLVSCSGFNRACFGFESLLVILRARSWTSCPESLLVITYFKQYLFCLRIWCGHGVEMCA